MSSTTSVYSATSTDNLLSLLTILRTSLSDYPNQHSATSLHDTIIHIQQTTTYTNQTVLLTDTLALKMELARLKSVLDSSKRRYENQEWKDAHTLYEQGVTVLMDRMTTPESLDKQRFTLSASKEQAMFVLGVVGSTCKRRLNDQDAEYRYKLAGPKTPVKRMGRWKRVLLRVL